MSPNHPQAKVKAENAHAEGIWSVAWSGSERLITGSLDGSIRLWNSRSLAAPISCTERLNVGVNSVVATDDGTTVLACYQDSYIRTYDINEETGALSERISEEQKKRTHPDLLSAWSISLSPDDDTYVAGSQNGKITFYSIKEDKAIKKASLPKMSHVMSTAFNHDGSLVAATAANGQVCIFDTSVSAESTAPITKYVHAFSAHSMAARSCKFSPDGHLLYTASDDQHVSIFDLRVASNNANAAVVKSFACGSMCLSLDVSPDGRHFTVGCADGNVSLWDLGMQRREVVYSSHTDQVWCVAYDRTNAEGKRFVSVGDDAMMQLYE